MPISSSLASMARVLPFLKRNWSVTMKARFLPITVPSFVECDGRGTLLEVDLLGCAEPACPAALATVLTLIKCFTPTFSETELPPREPQPVVRDGFMPKL